MCGIAVAIDWEDAERTVSRVLEGLSHRGDVTDPVVAPTARVALGTRRLRIVDAKGGEQPKLSSDGRILVALNGEIYNHEALRIELEELGVGFRTQSDTEVLANALSLWGPGTVGRLEGMYAFVAYDVGAGEFLAARDPFGVKPLYLIESGGGCLFASEIRPLLEASETGKALLVPPGHVLTRAALRAFKRPFVPPPASAAALDQLMRAAIHARVPPDLPFALLFSGGLDSTLVAHYARELAPRAPGYFLGDEQAPDFEYAARYADSSGLDMRMVSMSAPRHRTRERLAEVLSTIETFEPSVVRDALCNYALFERIHEDGFRVALCGEGADELFAGYVPTEVAFAHGREAGDYLRNQTIANMSRTNLQRLDRCSMRFQVEAREPMLDSALAAYALAVSPETLVATHGARPVGKQPLRELWDLYPEHLPIAIRRRRKVALHVGAGLDRSQNESPWIDYANEAVSDADFADARKEFALFRPTTKEEALYLRLLAERLDLTRVPHLALRPHLRFPAINLAKEAMTSLAEFLAAA